MAEHHFLVRMAANIFVVELAVKFRVDGHGLFVLHRPHVREFRASCFLVRLALLGKTFDAEELGVGVGFGPFRDEDVVLKVHGGQVGDIIAELFDGGADFGGEGSGREDS